jgi:hypothetical protein
MIKKTWTFESSSNPNKVYETQLHDDDSITCNCFGWTKRSARTCKHTRMVETEIADQYAKVVWTNPSMSRSAPTTAPAPDRQTQTNLKKLGKIKKQLKKEKPAPARFVNWG